MSCSLNMLCDTLKEKMCGQEKRLSVKLQKNVKSQVGRHKRCQVCKPSPHAKSVCNPNCPTQLLVSCATVHGYSIMVMNTVLPTLRNIYRLEVLKYDWNLVRETYGVEN